MSDHALHDDPTVVERLRRAVAARARQAFGLIALGAVLAITAMLATWSVGDPSLSHAIDGTPRNIFGYPGATLADLVIQILGLASVIALLPALVWSLNLIAARALPQRLPAVLCWIVGVTAAATALSALPAPERWPLPAGLGGLVGDGVLLLIERMLAFVLGGFATAVAGVLASVAAVVLLCGASGLPLVALLEKFAADHASEDLPDTADHDEPGADHPELEDREDRDQLHAPWLGAGLHALLSARAAVQRRLTNGRRSRREEDDATVNRQSRIEPFMAEPPQVSAGPLPPVPDRDLAADPDDEVIDGDYAVSGESWRSVEGSLTNRVAPQAGTPRKSRRAVREAQPSLLPTDGFELPRLDLLAEPKGAVRDPSLSEDALEQNARLLEGVLEDFGVRGEIIHVRPGPVVTLYELEPAPGTKSSRVIGLADDIARSMSAISARVAVIPGRNAIGIELPNAKRQTVYLREMISAQDFDSSKAKLALALGKTIGGEPVIADLARMPHLLIAGTTGSGKSVAINTMILSILYRMTPDDCRLIMIDPKMLELSVYDGIPHLLSPVVTDPKKAVVALKWTVREMEDRYKKMSKVGVRNIEGFNARVAQAKKKGETISRTVQTGFNRETGEAIYETEELDLEAMPFIVVIIDEMADLMMVAGKDIEGAVQRLAQMARAAGIHVIMATQRPSVDVITGTIKANFPTRISFQVTSKIDSRTILGEQGAEQLLGQGDMLYMMGGGRIRRVHGPFVSDEEVEDIVSFLKDQGTPEYLDAVTEDDDAEDAGGSSDGLNALAESNDLYDKAVAIVLRDKKASTSYIQRRLAIGYNRAASLIERMEQDGVIGPANHAGKREILVQNGVEEPL